MSEFIRERWGVILVAIGISMTMAFLMVNGHRAPRWSWYRIFANCLIAVGAIHHIISTWSGNRRYPWS